MSWFKKEKRLIDYDLEELSLEMLSHLQASLVANLILVNKELVGRYRSLVSLSGDLPGTSEAKEVLNKAADHLVKFTGELEGELESITRPHPATAEKLRDTNK